MKRKFSRNGLGMHLDVAILHAVFAFAIDVELLIGRNNSVKYEKYPARSRKAARSHSRKKNWADCAKWPAKTFSLFFSYGIPDSEVLMRLTSGGRKLISANACCPDSRTSAESRSGFRSIRNCFSHWKPCAPNGEPNPGIAFCSSRQQMSSRLGHGCTNGSRRWANERASIWRALTDSGTPLQLTCF